MPVSKILTKTQQIAVLLSEIDLDTVKNLSVFLSDNELDQISEAVKGVHLLNDDQKQETLEEFYARLTQKESQGYKNLFSSYNA